MVRHRTAIGRGACHRKSRFSREAYGPLPREGGVRETYLNYSFNPIFEEGAITGLFGSLYDVTGEVVAVRKLAESEARASRILQSIGDAVIVTDEYARITDMNHIAESLTGRILDEARGELLSTVFHIVDEKLRQPVESPADKVRRLGTIVGIANHTILIRKDGVATPIDDSGAPIWDEDGKLINSNCNQVFISNFPDAVRSGVDLHRIHSVTKTF
jgi:PAS domain S-box-containing protein